MPWGTDIFYGQGVQASPNDPLVGPDDFTEMFAIGDGSYASLPALAQNRVQTAIEIASASVRNGRRLFTAMDNEAVLVNGTGGFVFLLPKERLPVRDIASITETAWDGSVAEVASDSYSWDADGVVELTGRGHWCWTPRRQGLAVVYSHGYLTVPREVAGIVLAYAKRIYDDPSNSKVVREQLGDYQVEYEPGGGLLPDEILRLELYEASR